MQEKKSHDKLQYSSITLGICCKKVALKISARPISEWVNGDYVKLSTALARETKVYISENTLKRIFGKLKTNDRYSPQKATRDALVRFIGYHDWHEFELLHRNPETIETPQPVVSLPNNANRHTKQKTKLIILVVSVTLLGFIAYYFLSKSTKAYGNIRLICENPEGKTPHSALFKLKAETSSKNTNNHFDIYFDDHLQKKAKFVNTLITHYYDLPGVYYPKLILDGNAVDSTVIKLYTSSWETNFRSQNDTTRVFPLLSPKTKTPLTAISVGDAKRSGIDTSKTFYLNIANIHKTTISGDNFKLGAQITTSPQRAGIRCSQVTITVYGENAKHFFTLIKPACTSWVSCQFSEWKKDGIEYNLSAFGQDLVNGKTISLLVKNKKVTLAINNSTIFKVTYAKSIGKICGISFDFAGVGRVENFVLQDIHTAEQFK